MFLLIQTIDFGIIILYLLTIKYFQFRLNGDYFIKTYSNVKDFFPYFSIKVYLLCFPYLFGKNKKVLFYKFFILRLFSILLAYFLVAMEIYFFPQSNIYGLILSFSFSLTINILYMYIGRKINDEKLEIKYIFFNILNIIGSIFLVIYFILYFGN